MLLIIKNLYGAVFGLALARVLALLLALAAVVPAQAHDPFDGNTQVFVFDDRIEARVTLGYDAARDMLRILDLPAAEATMITRGASDAPAVLPPALAVKLMTLHAGAQSGAQTYTASAFSAAGVRDEVTFLIPSPRPPTGTVVANATYFDAVEYMRAGTLVVADAQRRVLASTLLSKSSHAATVPLSAAAGQARNAGFTAFFKLGVEHILTGFDHLLFLCALLVTVTRFRHMLGIVTAFTLAHSATLALAALGVVALPPSVVEPLIAVSIIVACVDNLLRREASRDRIWLAAGFGLIHGFGFASMLREAMMAQQGQGLLMPLLSFNLGVEAGQLVVAAVLIALLMFARRKEFFLRFGAPALSGVVIAISAYWLMQRTHMI
jgi:hypothetical protein